MDEFPLGTLLLVLCGLVILSAFFSGSETGLMALNRYRLRHLAKSGHPGAKRASKLLERQDRLIGVILLGNNLVNIAAASIATLIGMHLYGEPGIAIASGLLTLVILIFAEVTPKTLGAISPEKVAFPAAYVYTPLLWLLYPAVYLVSGIANMLLRLIGVRQEDVELHSLSSEELRTVVAETGAMIPRRHQRMLLSILDLEKATVEDIMVPRNEIVGIDLSEDWDEVMRELQDSEHTRLPLYDGSIDELRGIVHMRRLLGPLTRGELTRELIESMAREPYFIPEGTPLNQQLLNFQNQRRRIGFVVDEYGDIQGLVTLEDILEEIVGEFTTDPATKAKYVRPASEGGFLVDARVNVRSLNRSMGWKLPITGARTLNGLILQQLEDIPETGAKLKLRDYVLEIEQTKASAIESVRIIPPPKTA